MIPFAAVIIVILGLAGALLVLNHKGVVQTPTLTKDPSEALSTEESKRIWNDYTSLSSEFRTFPELFEVLMTLDKQTEVMRRANSRGELYHDHLCRQRPYSHSAYRYHGYDNDEMTDTCEACEGYAPYNDAVQSLVNAEMKRNLRILQIKDDETKMELSAKMRQYEFLANRMREEARIVNDVTREVY